MQDTLKNKLDDTRNYSLDIIRVLAIASVILTHTSSTSVIAGEIGSSMFFWGNIFDTLSRIGVPLFIMLSGALLLNEDKSFSVKNHFRHRTLDVVIALVFWSFIHSAIYNLVLPIINGNGVNIKNFVFYFINGHYHLWFLYMIIGIYLALPLLRKFVNKENKNLVLYYIIISLLANFFMPIFKALSLKFEIAESAIFLIEKFELGFFNSFLTYYLAGWYITNVKISKKAKMCIYIASIMSVIITFGYCLFTKDYENAYENNSIFIFLFSVGVFTAISNGFKSIGSKTKTILQFLSKMSFGIYIVHVFVLDVIKQLFIITGISEIYTPIYIILVFIATCVLSTLVTLILSKMPFIKKTVKC